MMNATQARQLLDSGITADQLIERGIDLNVLSDAMNGATVARNGKSRRLSNGNGNGNGKKTVTVSVIGASDSLPAPVKATKQALEAPKDAESIQYGDRVIAIHKVRKSFDGEQADYIQFTGFRARFGDFSLTMKQARLLADPTVQEALAAYMEKVPQ